MIPLANTGETKKYEFNDKAHCTDRWNIFSTWDGELIYTLESVEKLGSFQGFLQGNVKAPSKRQLQNLKDKILEPRKG